MLNLHHILFLFSGVFLEVFMQKFEREKLIRQEKERKSVIEQLLNDGRSDQVSLLPPLYNPFSEDESDTSLRTRVRKLFEKN